MLTGAGCSTESSVPDYRGPQGAYSTGFKPITHQQVTRLHSTPLPLRQYNQEKAHLNPSSLNSRPEAGANMDAAALQALMGSLHQKLCGVSKCCPYCVLRVTFIYACSSWRQQKHRSDTGLAALQVGQPLSQRTSLV